MVYSLRMFFEGFGFNLMMYLELGYNMIKSLVNGIILHMLLQ